MGPKGTAPASPLPGTHLLLGGVGGDGRGLLPDPAPLGDRAGPDGSGVAPAAWRRRASHQVVLSSSSRAATASRIRGAKVRGRLALAGRQRLAEPDRELRDVPGPASPGRAASRRRCRGARPAPPGRRAGRRGTPRRAGTGRPSRPCERVPSGKITRLQPSASTSPGVVAIEPAAPVDREGVEHDRRPDGAPPGVEEVVGRGRDRRTPPPLVGQRQQDQRGVEVGGVVGREDHRAVDPCEHVEPLDVPAHLGAHAPGRARPSGRPRARSAPDAAATSRSGTTVFFDGSTNSSAERGTSGRRPHRQPRATVRTSSTLSRRKPAIRSPRPRSGAAGCAGR